GAPDPTGRDPAPGRARGPDGRRGTAVSFDKPTRTALARMVADCREILLRDLEDQLQRTYGLQPEGTVLTVGDLAHLDDARREVARALRQWQGHLAGLAPGDD